ncbi:MAG: hypothetical protein K2Q22_06860 [Cytophagales bacterium]|nr:hypothetical protein [Cytophagales bacterium]
MRPASKYSFCNFQTGLSPFINKDPWVDTRSLIVPGSREELLSDLNRHFPAYIIDSSPANYYFYGKYPLSTFPELEAFIKKNYRREPIENSKTYSAHLYCRKI